ncbi:MAG: histidine triad nucleotide-binding protein [Gemmatimonadales bacterium]|nr:histidine triad nucleotide-binding protein [Gemmatimonadales bacterium]
MNPPDCIFCRIATGDVPAQIVGRSDHAVAFRDLSPQAPTHVLVIPTTHLASAAEATGPEGALILGEVMALGVLVAADLGLAESGYRFVMNTGREGGQTVHHLHLHVLGGRQMRWPPG